MTYPAATANLVVLWGRWWDHLSKAGVDATITATPLLATGQAGSGSPNLVSLVDQAEIKTAAWSTKPLPGSGLWALPLLPTNDAQFGAFGGYRIQAGSEPPFIVEILENTPTMVMSADMIAALNAARTQSNAAPIGISVNDVAQAVWVRQAAVLQSPAVAPPAGVLTSDQVVNLVAGVRQLPTGGTPGQVPTPKVGGGYEWVAQSGAGGGSATLTQRATVATASTVAAANEIVPLDTSDGGFTLSGPSNGGPFGARWKAGTAAPTIAAPDGSTILGVAAIPMGLLPAGSSGELVVWQRFGTDYQPVSGFKPQSANDARGDGRYSNLVLERAGLAGIAPAVTKRTKTEVQQINAGTTATLLNEAGAGVVRSIWLTANQQITAQRLRLQVFVDGEIVPSIDTDLASLFLSHGHAYIIGTNWSTKHIHGEGKPNATNGGTLRFPIPYGDGVRVVLRNDTSVNASNLYTQVDWQPAASAAAVPGYRLKSILRQFDLDPLVLGTSDTAVLWDLPAAATLAWLGFGGRPVGTSLPTYLERNLDIFLDGETTPSLPNSGTEDFFFSSYYWNGQTTYSTPSLGLSYYGGQNESHVGIDLLEHCGGYSSTSRHRAVLGTEAQVTVGHQMGYLALFYVPVSSAYAIPQKTVSPPGAVRGGRIRATATAATVSFYAPLNNGGAAPTSYAVTLNGVTVTVPASALAADLYGVRGSAVFTGLTANTSYTATIVATNSAGAGAPATVAGQTALAPATLVAGYAPGGFGVSAWFSADQITGLADGASVSTWTDQSGNTKNATQATAAAQPVYKTNQVNGLPALRFTRAASSALLTPDLALSYQVTAFLVCRFTGTPALAPLLFSNTGGSFVVGGDGTSGRLVVNAGNQDVGQTPLPDVHSSIGVLNVGQHGYHLVSALTSPSVGNVWIDGSGGWARGSGVNRPGVLSIGRNATASADVDIAEVVVFNGGLSAADRQKVESALAAKYSIPVAVQG